MATAAGLIMKPIVALRAVDTTVYGHFTKAKLCYALLLCLRCMVAAASLVFPAQRTRSTVFDALCSAASHVPTSVRGGGRRCFDFLVSHPFINTLASRQVSSLVRQFAGMPIHCYFAVRRDLLRNVLYILVCTCVLYVILHFFVYCNLRTSTYSSPVRRKRVEYWHEVVDMYVQ